MNSVHEPGPNGDSKISPSRKTVRKTKPDASALSRPNRHAQVRTGARMAAVSWPGPWPCRGKGPAVSQAPTGSIVASLLHALARFRLRPSASACSPRTLACSAYRAPRAQRRIVAAQPAVSWPPSRPCRGRVCAQAWPYRGLPRDTVPSRLATIQYFVLQPISNPTKHLSHNTSSVLRYTFCLAYPLPVAIQGLISQYNPQPSPLLLQYNIFLAIQMGSSPFQFFCTVFFFRFSL